MSDEFEDKQDCHYCDGIGLLDDATIWQCCEGSGEETE